MLEASQDEGTLTRRDLNLDHVQRKMWSAFIVTRNDTIIIYAKSLNNTKRRLASVIKEKLDYSEVEVDLL